MALVRGLPNFDLDAIKRGPAASISRRLIAPCGYVAQTEVLLALLAVLAGEGWGNAGFAGRMKNGKAAFGGKRQLSRSG
jgi:hypothetical protein